MSTVREKGRTRLDTIPRLAAGWSTPNTMDTLPARSQEAIHRQFSVSRKGRTAPANLREQVHPELYPNGWATPRAIDPRNGLPSQVLSGSTVETESTGQLNPALSRWLMGYPKEWCIAAIQANRATKLKKRE